MLWDCGLFLICNLKDNGGLIGERVTVFCAQNTASCNAI